MGGRLLLITWVVKSINGFFFSLKILIQGYNPTFFEMYNVNLQQQTRRVNQKQSTLCGCAGVWSKLCHRFMSRALKTWSYFSLTLVLSVLHDLVKTLFLKLGETELPRAA